MTSTAGDEATTERKHEIEAWFANYDALVAAGDLEAMADQALFPLNEVTDDPQGFGLVSATDRERFIAQMREAGVGAGDVEMRSKRTPIFLSAGLVFVVTDAEFVAEGGTTTMRYGDLLVRTPSGWRFQTMVAGGWSAEL
ncbi:MAG TPA: nuclear transport factor 2 family protein [Propionibacteriaceae bacterium]|nr:nuclear transport factor 2 family protein [Propionibacteriaceae bacterium]